ncbi:lipocalin-like domain-containing protein, partial [uncultured Ruegeria sp.]|uniref:lipocalin-like domain-containing protein n=1 Tax=uncultured Ruegeria sp. TaxID=259304 RepID=UPI0026143C3C
MADESALIGSWKMDAWTRTSVETGETTDALGPDPIGYIAYHADGRMMATVFRRDRPEPGKDDWSQGKRRRCLMTCSPTSRPTRLRKIASFT